MLFTSHKDKDWPSLIICSTFLSLHIFDKTRFVTFHETTIQRNYMNCYLSVRENESAHDLDSLCAIVKMMVTKPSPQSDDAKLQCFDAAAWINFIITLVWIKASVFSAYQVPYWWVFILWPRPESILVDPILSLHLPSLWKNRLGLKGFAVRKPQVEKLRRLY